MIPVVADLTLRKFVGTIKKSPSNTEIIYGKPISFSVNIVHYITINEPDDFNIVFKKCEGCQLDDRTILDRPIFTKDSCVFASNSNKTYCIENNKTSSSKALGTNNSYIIQDITQRYFESKALYEEFLKRIRRIFCR